MQNSKMYNDIRTGNFDFKAFVDPNDPTKVYAQQPKM
jgi:pyocin large subunit-like protein